MTELEQRAARALPTLAFAPNSGHPKIAYRVYRIFLSDPLWDLSPEEQADLWFLIWHYRRQVTDKELVKHADELVNGALSLSF